ncbi:MAG: hypothetical protein M1521_08390 [Thermotogae bacterium]|jgi:hypothetical protein|nr:hypothetical protein [Thermotogota bacterium]
MAEEKKDITIWNAKTIDEFLGVLGEKIDLEAFGEAKKKLVIPTMYGDVALSTYDALVATKLFQYFQYGVAYRVGKMMKSQDANIDVNDTKIVLLEMARLEIEYGLRPITHVLPVGGSTYIKADGYLFYGKRSGKLRGLKYEEHEEKGVWTTKCVVETTDGVYDGIATESPNGNRMSDPREKARTKSMRRALRKAFPIGASDEPLTDIEEIENGHVEPVKNSISDLNHLNSEKSKTPISDLSELKISDKKEEVKTDDLTTTKVKELSQIIDKMENKALLTHDIKFRYGVKSLSMLTEQQAQEAIESLTVNA